MAFGLGRALQLGRLLPARRIVATTTQRMTLYRQELRTDGGFFVTRFRSDSAGSSIKQKMARILSSESGKQFLAEKVPDLGGDLDSMEESQLAGVLKTLSGSVDVDNSPLSDEDKDLLREMLSENRPKKIVGFSDAEEFHAVEEDVLDDPTQVGRLRPEDIEEIERDEQGKPVKISRSSRSDSSSSEELWKQQLQAHAKAKGDVADGSDNLEAPPLDVDASEFVEHLDDLEQYSYESFHVSPPHPGEKDGQVFGMDTLNISETSHEKPADRNFRDFALPRNFQHDQPLVLAEAVVDPIQEIIDSGSERLDHTNVLLLTDFVNDAGKILPRRITGCSAKNQRKLAKLIKRARHLGYMNATEVVMPGELVLEAAVKEAASEQQDARARRPRGERGDVESRFKGL